MTDEWTPQQTVDCRRLHLEPGQSTGGIYVRVGPDSLRTATGLEGRVWGDTAAIRTTSWTLVGAHVYEPPPRRGSAIWIGAL